MNWLAEKSEFVRIPNSSSGSQMCGEQRESRYIKGTILPPQGAFCANLCLPTPFDFNELLVFLPCHGRGRSASMVSNGIHFPLTCGVQWSTKEIVQTVVETPT